MKNNDNKTATNGKGRKLRSLEWFNNPHNPGMTALYLERYLNYGLTRHELQSGKPIIGIAQTGNDLSPCNRHHLELAHRVREGIRAAGGIANAVADPLGQFEVMAVAGREVGAGLGDADDRLARGELLAGQAEIEVALEI